MLEINSQTLICKNLKKQGISTGIHYPIALPNLKAYTYIDENNNGFPEATKASGEIVSLPMYPELEESQIHCIRSAIKHLDSYVR